MTTKFSKKEFLAFDISERLTKICLCQGDFNKYKIDKTFLVENPDRAVVDGQIINPDELKKVYSELLTENAASHIKVATIVFSSSKVISREVPLPVTTPQKIKSIVDMNVGEYFPIDVSNYYFAHKVIGITPKPDSKSKVMITGVPKHILKSYFDLADMMNIAIKSIDTSLNAQYQLFKNIKHHEVTMFINLSLTNSTVLFMDKGNLLFQRQFPIGCEELLLESMKIAEFTDDEYLEAIGNATEKNWFKSTLTTEVTEEMLGKLINTLIRTDEMFKASFPEMEVRTITFAGICGNFPEIRRIISKKMGIDTLLLTDYEYMKRKQFAIENLYFYTTCIAGTLEPLDIIPEELNNYNRKKSGKSDSLAFGVIVCILLIAVGVSTTIFPFLEHTALKSELKDYRKELADSKIYFDAYDTFIMYQNMQNELSLIELGYANENQNLKLFFEELQEKMPSSLHMLSATCDATSVTMNITVGSMEDAAVVIDNLEQFETIALVYVSPIEEELDELGQNKVSFSLNCLYAQDNSFALGTNN